MSLQGDPPELGQTEWMSLQGDPLELGHTEWMSLRGQPCGRFSLEFRASTHLRPAVRPGCCVGRGVHSAQRTVLQRWQADEGDSLGRGCCSGLDPGGAAAVPGGQVWHLVSGSRGKHRRGGPSTAAVLAELAGRSWMTGHGSQQGPQRHKGGAPAEAPARPSWNCAIDTLPPPRLSHGEGAQRLLQGL